MSDTYEATNPEAEAPTEVADEAEAQGDEHLEIDPETGEPVQPEEETEEIEHEGKKYALPKAVKPLLMMQADYTRKTQEVAQTRQALEQRAQAVAQQAEAITALREDYGKLHALKGQVEAYNRVDWAALNAEDPANGQAHWMQYQQLKDALSSAEQDLSKKESERLQQQQAGLAKALKETGEVLSRDIPNWGPELATKLVQTAASHGFDLQELQETADPRAWKVLHKAHLYDQLMAKQKTVQRQTTVASVTPAKTVGAKTSAPPTGLDDRLSTEEWVRRRNAQEAARRKAGR